MERICKSFDGKVALDSASLILYPGEILGLVGDNGAGKSTLLKVLAGVYRKDSGSILIEEKEVEIQEPSHAKRLGIEMVYQDLALCGSLTVWENIFLARYEIRSLFKGFLPILDKRKMRDRATHVLKELGIELVNLDIPLRSLSGGEQQAVALSRCLIARPKVVLLDEPTASMALWEREKILNRIQMLKHQGHALIMVTHNLTDLFRVADRVSVLKEGKSIWSGPLKGLEPHHLAQMMFAGRMERKEGT